MGDEQPIHERETLVHPGNSAQRAGEYAQQGNYRDACYELMHGLASLFRQHNDLVRRHEELEESYDHLEMRVDILMMGGKSDE